MKAEDIRFIIFLIMIIYFISILWYGKKKYIMHVSANDIFKVMIKFCIAINLFI